MGSKKNVRFYSGSHFLHMQLFIDIGE